MNFQQVMQTLAVANQVRSAFGGKKKSEKNSSFFDELRDSSANISDLRQYLESLDEREKATLSPSEARRRRQLRAEVSPITRASHLRLQARKDRLAARKAAPDALDFEKAKDFFSDLGDNAEKTVRSTLRPWKKKVKKQSKKAQKAAHKARQKAEAKITKRQRRAKAKKLGKNAGIVAGILAAIAAIGYVLTKLFSDKPEPPAARPPRVEEHSGERASTLVYSSTSEDDYESPVEPPAKRDEELLDSIDEQLAAHRRENSEALAEASDSLDEAAERLRQETEAAEKRFQEETERHVNEDKN